jgi:aspartate carbamoyltransferase catalytic subunit
VAPPTLLPPSLVGWPVRVAHRLDDVLDDLDVVYLLRMQRERMTEALVPTLREYTAGYGLTVARAARLGSDAVVMHPGPMNRGVEIAPEVADDPRSVIVAPVRMAVLYRLLGAEGRTGSLPPAAADAPPPDPAPTDAPGPTVDDAPGPTGDDPDRPDDPGPRADDHPGRTGDDPDRTTDDREGSRA